MKSACTAVVVAIACLLVAPFIFASAQTAVPPVDCILVAYGDGQDHVSLEMGRIVARQFSGERVITYPNNYVPVLIPKSEVEKIKKQLPGRFLELSPKLK